MIGFMEDHKGEGERERERKKTYIFDYSSEI